MEIERACQFMRLANTFSQGTPSSRAMGTVSSRKPPEMRYTAMPRDCSAPISSLMPCAHAEPGFHHHHALTAS